ncbi:MULTISPECIES: cyanase [Mycobacteroides]|jgi:cyanate lyase|uniref:Cyanate hydratase n=1 Tax=Mycobacteroides chelonae TaxID=1774 RepID=A0AB73TYH5_MYCCH|nr:MULTISPECIES: cyanase [Mycobacteroides]PKQ56283.1 cyanase [Mycobacterium sp. MHSD3]SKO38496.1 cyanate hydratase [Mycobacteroides abscessus subsp. bolletii]KRQ23588.1 cyanate hydratase [Mycobacteroides sp. H072]KRQ36524.1 cyanate hydratase [Mycobacteroides sp. H002]KRQ54915.1 cyanate hydratase [Mycobacteroides sp. H054]
MTKDEAAELITARRLEKKLTWQHIAEAIDSPLIWTIAALLGQHPVPEAKAAKVAELLELGPQVTAALRAQPYRGTLDGGAPSDPTIYRLYEALSVYGPAIKEAIHEEFGDGIMSAINFKVDIARRADPDGDRVVLTLDGKFLDYRW